MEKLDQLDGLIEEAERKLMGVCEDGCESTSPERWAEIGDAVRGALHELKQQIVLLYSSDHGLAKTAKAGRR
jgi:hypothetical protein